MEASTLTRDEERRLTRAAAKRLVSIKSTLSSKGQGACVDSLRAQLARAEQTAAAATKSASDAYEELVLASKKLSKSRTAIATMEELESQLLERRDKLLAESERLSLSEETEREGLLGQIHERADAVTAQMNEKTQERLAALQEKQSLQSAAAERLASLETSKQTHAVTIASIRLPCSILEVEMSDAVAEVERLERLNEQLVREAQAVGFTDGLLRAELEDAASSLDAVQAALRQVLESSNSTFAARKAALDAAVSALEKAHAEYARLKPERVQLAREARADKERLAAVEAEALKLRAQRDKMRSTREVLKQRFSPQAEPVQPSQHASSQVRDTADATSLDAATTASVSDENSMSTLDEGTSKPA